MNDTKATLNPDDDRDFLERRKVCRPRAAPCCRPPLAVQGIALNLKPTLGLLAMLGNLNDCDLSTWNVEESDCCPLPQNTRVEQLSVEESLKLSYAIHPTRPREAHPIRLYACPVLAAKMGCVVPYR